MVLFFQAFTSRGVFGGVGGWVSEFWTSGTVYMLKLTISMSIVCLTQFGHKVD